MSARTAAISWGEVILYWDIAVMRWGAAWTLVAHSVGNRAPAQVFDDGAILRSTSAAEGASRREMGFEVSRVGLGIAEAQTRLLSSARMKVLDNIFERFVVLFVRIDLVLDAKYLT